MRTPRPVRHWLTNPLRTQATWSEPALPLLSPLPDAVQRGILAALESECAHPVQLRAASRLGGGCINPSARLDTADGEAFFVKWNPAAAPEMFLAEGDGLEALRQAGTPAGVRIPRVIATGGGAAGGPPWLLLEFVERGRAPRGYGERLGRGLAALHRFDASEAHPYGWKRDNFIGSMPQTNPRLGSWPDFWRDVRLVPQLELARSRGFLRGDAGRTLDALLRRTEDALAGAEAEGPSLLHGDLWSGNVYPGPEGEPVLIDPAVYRGHREVDLAMSELFGGFPDGFLEAYHEVWPLSPEYARVRRPLYQLYYLLVHVNLFGGSYADSCVRAARSVLAEL